MPRAQFDPSTVSAGVPVLNDGDYEFSIGEAKPFARVNDENKQVSGILYQLITKDESGDTKRIPHNLFMHNADGFGFVKIFLMAALGFDPKDKAAEREFDAQYSNDIWLDIDWDGKTPEVKEIGPIWGQVAGGKIAATATTTMNKKTNDPQNQFKFRPVDNGA